MGALGSYAAAAEFAFGTIFQRIMSWPGGVRMHYGHPDVWNKLEVMTQVRLGPRTLPATLLWYCMQPRNTTLTCTWHDVAPAVQFKNRIADRARRRDVQILWQSTQILQMDMPNDT